MCQVFETHMFWANGSFSNVEKISVNSFLRHGYQLTIWTYGDVANAPSGVTINDAREILPEALFFSLPNGSCGPFSDLFRYAVLNKFGGLWVDTDVIALKPFDELPSQPFLVTQRVRRQGIRKLVKETLLRKTSFEVNNNVIFNPAPASGNLIDLAYVYAERFPKHKIGWGELGPALLSAIEKIYPDHGFKIMSPEFANPIDYWSCPSALLGPATKLRADSVFIHLYNQTWSDAGVDKNAPFPTQSLMSVLAKQYL